MVIKKAERSAPPVIFRMANHHPRCLPAKSMPEMAVPEVPVAEEQTAVPGVPVAEEQTAVPEGPGIRPVPEPPEAVG